jgi:hypothetical protein
MSRHGLDSPILRFPTDGALAANRLVVLGSDGFPDLASATSENAIGATLGAIGGAADQNRGVLIALRNKPGVIEVEVAAGVTLAIGAIAYQANDGKLSDTGTVRAGVCTTGGTAGQTIELLSDCGFAFAAP